MAKEVRIYYTSDMHGYLFPTDYADNEEKNMGLLKVMESFEKDGNTLILDGGDFLQGSPYINYYQKKHAPEQGVAEVMNAAGYDVVTLGNHDFNYGVPLLQRNLALLAAKVSAVNVVDEAGTVLFPAQIQQLENGLKVGIVGITTDYTMVWEKPENLGNIRIIPPFEAARQALQEINAHVDLTICLYHGGFEVDLTTGKRLSETTENIGYRLAKELSFDVLLTGHQHGTVLGQELFGTYVVQPADRGKNFFYLQAQVQAGKWEIQSQLMTPTASPNPEWTQKLLPLQKDVQHYLDRPVGSLPQAVPLMDHLTVAQRANAWFALIAHVQKQQTDADISIVSSVNELRPMPRELTVREILLNYPFENTLYVVKLTGRQLREAMEKTASYFTLEGGQLMIDPSWLSPKMEHYNYDFYFGVAYVFDVTRPIGQRVTSLLYKGKKVTETQVFRVAVNNYRARGGGEYSVYAQAKQSQDTGREIQQLLIDLVEKGNKITKVPDLELTIVNE